MTEETAKTMSIILFEVSPIGRWALVEAVRKLLGVSTKPLISVLLNATPDNDAAISCFED